jgi:Na+-driven multidrug efflux pump
MIKYIAIRGNEYAQLNSDESSKVNLIKSFGTFMKNRPAVGCTVAAMGMFLGMQSATTATTIMFATHFGQAKLSGVVMAAVAPVFPMIYETTDSVRSLATYMTLISAALIPFCAFAYCTYFVIRTGGRVLLTFMMDCGIMWSIVIPISLVLANFTPISIELLFLIGQGAEAVKLIPGLIILKKGSWAKSLV